MPKDGFSIFIPQKMCRCCGMEKTSGISLKDNNDRSAKLTRNIALLPKKVINITSTDKLTKFVCVDCEMTLQHFSEFCEMIKKVQKTLKSYLKSSEAGKNSQKKPGKKTDCHITGTSSNGSPVVITVGSNGLLRCEDCQSSLVASQLITLHMLTHGLGSVLCACKHCGHRDDIEQFLQHNNDQVKCPQCPFVNYEENNVPVKSAEKPTNGRHVCEVCSARFRTKYRLNRHKLIHVGIKPFLCETCGKKFNQKTSLKLHVMKHSKVNPHKCQWCGQSFRFKVSLQSHILNIHGNVSESDNKNECNQCHKQFATSYKLKRHYRLHTGDRPYSCPICDKGFSQTGNLKNHLKKHKENSSSFPENFNEIESDQILDNILDSCPQGKQYLDLPSEGQSNYNLVGDGNVDKHNATDLFSDFNPQDVLFDNTPMIPPPTASPIILPNFSSLQGGTSEINM